jgi:hypothetical protein
VEKEAKRTYIKVRKEIHSYDDFYEFLLSNFESNHNSKCQLKRSSYTTNATVNPDISCLNLTSNCQEKSKYPVDTVGLSQKNIPLHTTTGITNLREQHEHPTLRDRIQVIYTNTHTLGSYVHEHPFCTGLSRKKPSVNTKK